MARQYVRVLEAVVADSDQAIGRVEVLGPEERRRILEEWNDTATAVPESTLPALFEEQVGKAPEAVAVIYEDAKLSYRELNEGANRLAHCLIARAVGPESVVGIALERSTADDHCTVRSVEGRSGIFAPRSTISSRTIGIHAGRCGAGFGTQRLQFSKESAADGGNPAFR